MNLLNPVASKRRYMQVAEESRGQRCDVHWMPNGLVTHNVGYGVVSLSLSLSLLCSEIETQESTSLGGLLSNQDSALANSRESVVG